MALRKEQQVKHNIYFRLLRALPEDSPPQRFLFETFFMSFSTQIQGLPALPP